MALLKSEDRKYTKPEDICAHVGDDYPAFNGATNPPIYQTSLFIHNTPENGVDNKGFVYSRVSNPTAEVAERKIAALEGGDGCLTFSSGMAAITSAILHFARAGKHMVGVCSQYGPTHVFMENYLCKRMDMSASFVKGDTAAEILEAITPDTCLVYLESPSSGIFKMQDIDAVTAYTNSLGIGTVMDNTYATPLFQHPLAHGVSISVHTASKYLGGHSDIVAGALICGKEIHDSIQTNERELLGGCIDPHQSWLLTRGIRTLPQRLKQHYESASKVASFLEGHPKVERVYYPSSKTYPQKELFNKYMTGSNGLLSFIPQGSPEAVMKSVRSLRLFQKGVSWGGFESLVCPLTVEANREKAAWEDLPLGLVRLHIGLENVDSLLEDLDGALKML